MVFGVVLPTQLATLKGYFPYQYPRSWMYSFTYTPGEDGATLSFRALPFDFQPFRPPTKTAARPAIGPGQAAGDGGGAEQAEDEGTSTAGGEVTRAIPTEHLRKGVLKVLGMVCKWGSRHQPTGTR